MLWEILHIVRFEQLFYLYAVQEGTFLETAF